jgi:hypothetical protein
MLKVSNTPIEGMWSMMSMLQMLSYVTLIKLHYPPNLLIFFDCLEYVHNFNKWLPNIFDYILRPSELNLEAYNQQYEDRGFPHRNFLLLCGPDILVLLGILLFTGLVIPLASLCSYFLCLHSSRRFFKRIQKNVQYSTLHRAFVKSNLRLCLSSFLNLGVVS